VYGESEAGAFDYLKREIYRLEKCVQDIDEKVKCCIVVVLATRAGVHEAANLRALVSWPIGGRRVCLALASMGTVLDRHAQHRSTRQQEARSGDKRWTAGRLLPLGTG
jgi:hypothetical protein